VFRRSNSCRTEKHVESDEELKARLDQFDQFIEKQKQALRREERNKQDIEDEIAGFREQLSELLSAKGQLSAEAEVNHNSNLILRSILTRRL
jgi:chromosome segregation ATPase